MANCCKTIEFFSLDTSQVVSTWLIVFIVDEAISRPADAIS